MHVAEAGSGRPLLLPRGFPQHWWEWRTVIPGLAERFRVIRPDLRGAAWTGVPRRGYTRDQLHGVEDYVDAHDTQIVAGTSHSIVDDAPDVVVARALGFFTPRPGADPPCGRPWAPGPTA